MDVITQTLKALDSLAFAKKKQTLKQRNTILKEQVYLRQRAMRTHK